MATVERLALPRPRLASLLLVSISVAAASRAEAQSGWVPTGSLATARSAHTATLLPNGKVLVAGGGNGLSSAELYDPASGTWTATGSLATGRERHAAVLLPN